MENRKLGAVPQVRIGICAKVTGNFPYESQGESSIEEESINRAVDRRVLILAAT
jgi:hypothetical protein